LGLKFQIEGNVPQQPFFVSENYMKWLFMWYTNVGRTFFRFDGQADVRTDGFTVAIKPRCIQCSAVMSVTDVAMTK